MPTVPSETIIRNSFDKLWEQIKFHGWDISYKLKSEIETAEEEIVENLKSYKHLEEWEEEWYDTKEEVEDEAYWRGHDDGVDQGYNDAKMECKSCSQ